MADIAPKHGLYFEQFGVGDTVTSQGRTITEADIVNFAALSGDWNPIHVDAEHAKEGIFGERIAHGLLGLSVATGLAAQLGFITETAIAFRGLEWKFVGAIRIGDTIHMRADIAETKAMPRLGGGLVTLSVEIVNQRGEVVQRGTWTMLMKAKP